MKYYRLSQDVVTCDVDRDVSNRNSRRMDAHNQDRRAVRQRTAKGTFTETARIEMRQSQLLKNQPATAEHYALHLLLFARKYAFISVKWRPIAR